MTKHIEFQWDEGKNAINRKKHGVSFEEARSCFYDENALLISDPDHSEAEDRFILLGLSSTTKLLVVCHCYREVMKNLETIRIISARKTEKYETKQYRNRGQQ